MGVQVTHLLGTGPPSPPPQGVGVGRSRCHLLSKGYSDFSLKTCLYLEIIVLLNKVSPKKGNEFALQSI